MPVSQLTSLALRQALPQPGCPICRLRSESEMRYIRSLLWEHVNDPVTRGEIIASLGYCPEHVWQTGLVETERFGVPLGNVMIYEHLVDVIKERLKVYSRRVLTSRRTGWRRWWHLLIPDKLHRSRPEELQPQARCRVCQIGDQTEHRELTRLLQSLSDADGDVRALYNTSDGLCLPHLRLSLKLADQGNAAGVEYLVESALCRLSHLQRDLREFERKHAWDHRHEEQTESELNAWLRALSFFGGSGKWDNRDEE